MEFILLLKTISAPSIKKNNNKIKNATLCALDKELETGESIEEIFLNHRGMLLVLISSRKDEAAKLKKKIANKTRTKKKSSKQYVMGALRGNIIIIKK